MLTRTRKLTRTHKLKGRPTRTRAHTPPCTDAPDSAYNEGNAGTLFPPPCEDDGSVWWLP